MNARLLNCDYEPAAPLVPFCKLADAAGYCACGWDLLADESGRRHWVEFFKRHLETILEMGVRGRLTRGENEDSLRRSREACMRGFHGHFDAFAMDPGAHGRVTILTLDQWRDRHLREHGFVDAFAELKRRENEKMLPLLPEVCRQIDALADRPDEQLRALIEGIFAGNIFDMGADATAAAFLHASPDFFETRRSLKPRPWLIDDYDALAARLLRAERHRKAVFFIDNAGSDFLLGAIPMIRWLAQRGTRIVLAANERPTLNDMTIGDVQAWWGRIEEAAPSLAGLAIERVSTGTGEPLIDLSGVSAELNAASADADLIILEGMGRGVESNLDAAFTCDVVNLAMLKDVAVARRHGGALYDVVCQFRNGDRGSLCGRK